MVKLKLQPLVMSYLEAVKTEKSIEFNLEWFSLVTNEYFSTTQNGRKPLLFAEKD
jgi:hypothetical protein